MMKQINKQLVMQSGKVVLAAIVAILLASVCKLDYAVSAGIVAILTIQPTKSETVYTALGRFYAFLVALMIAFVCFRLFGYGLPAFFVYLVFYIPICHILNWHSAMAMNSVLISHFISLGRMNGETLTNEAFIFIIGVGAGIVANLHLHKREDYILRLQKDADVQIVKILSRMSERIVNMDISDYNGDCFVILENRIRLAKNVAEENYKNQFREDDTFDMEYIAMRQRQCRILYEMYKHARELNSSPGTAKRVSDFMENMAKGYHMSNDGKDLMARFEEMDLDMKNQPLPVTREEFEDRARLFALMGNIEEFIRIKIEFAEKFS